MFKAIYKYLKIAIPNYFMRLGEFILSVIASAGSIFVRDESGNLIDQLFVSFVFLLFVHKGANQLQYIYIDLHLKNLRV